MAPKRRAAAAVPSEEEYEVDSEVSSSEISSPEVSSSDEDASQDWAPAAQGKTRAASRRSRRPSYEVQQARRGREKALKKLQSARKASTAKTNTRSKPRRRAPIDVSSEEEYQQESSEDSEYKESSEEEEEKPPPKRNRRAARALMRPVAMPKPRRGGALVTGERDYVHSDEDFSDGRKRTKPCIHALQRRFECLWVLLYALSAGRGMGGKRLMTRLSWRDPCIIVLQVCRILSPAKARKKR